MKKLIAVLLIVIAVGTLLCACSKPSNPEGNPAMRFVGKVEDRKTIYYVRDKMTDNMYMQVGQSRESGGLTPLYDKNGDIMKYDEWLRLASEYNVYMYVYGASN